MPDGTQPPEEPKPHKPDTGDSGPEQSKEGNTPRGGNEPGRGTRPPEGEIDFDEVTMRLYASFPQETRDVIEGAEAERELQELLLYSLGPPEAHGVKNQAEFEEFRQNIDKLRQSLHRRAEDNPELLEAFSSITLPTQGDEPLTAWNIIEGKTQEDEQQGSEAQEKFNEDFEDTYTQILETLTDEERARYEAKQIKENLREYIRNQSFPTTTGDSRGMHAEFDMQEFKERIQDEEKIKKLIIDPESGKTLWDVVEESTPPEEPPSPDQDEEPPTPEEAREAEEQAKEADEAARRFVSDPTEENRRLAQVAMDKAYDPHLVEHLRKVNPWWYKTLMAIGIAFYLYIGLQYAAASALETYGKSSSGGGKGH